VRGALAFERAFLIILFWFCQKNLEKKTIHLDSNGKKDCKIKTRVVEERQSEWEDGKWV